MTLESPETETILAEVEHEFLSKLLSKAKNAFSKIKSAIVSKVKSWTSTSSTTLS